MKLTRSSGYALVAVGHVARNFSGDLVLARDIAKQHKIPLDYLLKILQQLVRADVLQSIRGPRGGFSLARPAAKISILDIVEAVDGPFTAEPRLCGSKALLPYNKKLIAAYKKASKQASEILSKTTVAQLGPGKETNPPKRKPRKKTTRR
ncbi:MAG: Rrf2 family transcriptional regulator [Sedimentisphaerales bacterium]|nr:Rrf2 family transcriptional regulator [Sedimentisphaerales bacterium]